MLTEKKCKGPCGQVKQIDEYHWKSKRKGIRQARCKACMSEYGHEHYLANTDAYKTRANTRLKDLRTRNHDLVKNFMKTTPCAECGEANPKLLVNSLNSTQINNLSSEDLLVEMSKCVVSCRNCRAKQD